MEAVSVIYIPGSEVGKMILADKIIGLRKKTGWSQEELAEQLGVSRQSVSKWEGAQSVPDMERILQMSRSPEGRTGRAGVSVAGKHAGM